MLLLATWPPPLLDIVFNSYHVLQVKGQVIRLAGKNPGEVIVQKANDEDVDFLVTGTRGLGRIRRTFVGSVSDFILHHAHMPVFVCRHGKLDKHQTGH